MKPAEQMSALIEQLKQDTVAAQITALRGGKKTNVGLVNHYKLHDFIPNKWFDWINRADAEIMIIGQDWGPYSALKKYVDSYEIESQNPDFDYNKFLFSAFSSRTEKFILKAIETTYTQAFGKFDAEIWDEIIFTMAVLFTRQGEHFRGANNFDPKQSAANSYPYVSKQIEIVSPKVIITLGGMAFDVVNRHFELSYDGRTVTRVIEELGDDVIQTEQAVIIPNFHPASHTDPKLQLRIWSKIWKYI